MNEKNYKNAKVEKLYEKAGEKCTPYRYRSLKLEGKFER